MVLLVLSLDISSRSRVKVNMGESQAYTDEVYV